MVVLLVSITVLHLVTLAMLLIATLEKVRQFSTRPAAGLCYFGEDFLWTLLPIRLSSQCLFSSLGSAVLVGLV